MKYKKPIILISMLLLLMFCFTAVAAQENTTDMGSEEITAMDEDEPVVYESYNAQIIAENVSQEYRSAMGNEILFNLEDLDGNPIGDADPKVTYDNKIVDAYYDDENHYGQGWGTYVLDVNPKVGTHSIKIELNTSMYTAKPVLMKVKLTKATTKLTLSKYVTTTKEYAVMKATVKDKYNNKIYEGKVKFKVNGKTYTVKVKNGVATKKIKLKKAKTYTYKATFTSTNFKTKTASSKLYIKKTKKYYTLKIRSYKVKLPYKKYVKILNAKNKGKFGYAHVDTGIRRPPEYGGGHYCVGLSTNDEYHTYYGYPMHDYVFLRASSYLDLKKVNLYTSNF